MSKRFSDVLGIVGGLGPRATARLYLGLTSRAAPDHHGALPEIVVHSVPVTQAIEDAFLVGAVDEASAELQAIRAMLGRAVDALRAAGATRIAMPCNTLQDELAAICAARGVRLLHMVDATAQAIRAHGVGRVVVLATRSTCEWDVYGARLRAHGVQCVYPPPSAQKAIERRIRSALDLRIGRGSTQLADSLRGVLQPGDGVVIGCTDLAGDWTSLVDVPVFDALECLIEAATATAPSPWGDALVRRAR